MLDIIEHRPHVAGIALQHRDIDEVLAIQVAIGVHLHRRVAARRRKLHEIRVIVVARAIGGVEQRRQVEFVAFGEAVIEDRVLVGRAWRFLKHVGVCAGTADQRVVAGAAEQVIVVVAAVEDVGSGIAEQQVGATAARQRVRIVSAEQHVRTVAAEEAVVIGAAIEDVVAIATI